jgi:CHAD domain-containing protein
MMAKTKPKEILSVSLQLHPNIQSLVIIELLYKGDIMNKNAVTAGEYFLQQQITCTDFLQPFTRKKDAEDLHKLRVAVKKIKAVLLMLSKLQAHFDFDKHYAPYKNIFRQLGPIREEILHAERLKKDAGNKLVNTGSSAIVAGFNKELSVLAQGYLKAIQEELPVIVACLHKLDREKIYPYCEKLLKRLKSKWKDIKKDKELHKYRKLLKQFLYCSNLLTPEEKSKLLLAKEYKQLDKLQDLIGAWHDNVLLMDKIENEGLKVSPQFLLSLRKETKSMKEKIYRRGNKL